MLPAEADEKLLDTLQGRGGRGGGGVEVDFVLWALIPSMIPYRWVVVKIRAPLFNFWVT